MATLNLQRRSPLHRALIAAAAACFAILPSASLSKAPRNTTMEARNVTLRLPPSPTSGLVTVDLDLILPPGTSTQGLGIDVFLMGPDRTFIGQEGSTRPTPISGGLRFKIEARLLDRSRCPPRLFPQQVLLVTRNARIIQTLAVTGAVLPNPRPGGCKG